MHFLLQIWYNKCVTGFLIRNKVIQNDPNKNFYGLSGVF